ncbi:hypothetical protein [Bartonella sp. CL34QHWL]|uniref:hypothetical protein n=1 Tax=Bartonella sp. CL34QHWL TaxID=3243526 RepID=UPI0035D12B87
MEPNNLDSSSLDSKKIDYSNILGYPKKIDFIISKKECNESKFEYYLPEELNIKSVRLKSISFFNSWWIFDFLPQKIKIIFQILNYDSNVIWKSGGHFSLTKLCSLLQTWIDGGGFKGEENNQKLIVTIIII